MVCVISFNSHNCNPNQNKLTQFIKKFKRFKALLEYKKERFLSFQNKHRTEKLKYFALNNNNESFITKIINGSGWRWTRNGK